MHKLYELKDKLMSELEGYAENGKFSKEDAEAIKALSASIEHICNIAEDEEDYSSRSYDDGMGGSYRRSYRGGSYRGGSYDGGNGSSYARGRGRNARRDSMGRYSGEGYSRNSDIAERLREMVNEAPENAKRELERLADKMEQM